MCVSKGDLTRILHCASEAGISDVYISTGCPVYWRRGEVLSPLKEYIPSAKDIYEIFKFLVRDDHWDTMAAEKAVNSTCQLGEWRYRIHVYRKSGQLAFAIRVLPREIPELAALGQAAMIGRFSRYRQGLLLVTGATGAGKSTTVASFLAELNRQERLHILTLEDPVEFVYPQSSCLVSQLERGEDFADYGQALENAMREAPDVIMVSEMRDRETVQAVLNAALSGHYVVATMHAGSAAEAIERLVSMYPAGQQPMAQSLLSASLVGVCSQRLLPGRGGIKQCAVECLHANHAVRNIIRSGKYEQLYNVMQSGRGEGMQTMEMAVEALERKNLLQPERGKDLSAG